jgi:hypothetical protein
VVGAILASTDELPPYQHMIRLIDALPRAAWRLPFGEMVRRPEWAEIRRAARELYDALTPEARRRLRLVARSFSINHVVANVFLDYAAARAFLLDELPADDPDQLMGYVLLIDEEVEGYRKFVHALRALPDGDGTMPFPEVVKLEGWPVVRQAAQQLYDCLSD